MTNIDVIILSYATDEQLRKLTEQSIQTLKLSENESFINFEILIIESNNSMFPYQYKGTKTIYPKTSFGYNKFMNIGINMTTNKYVCLCNNDLIFHKNWATQILNAMDNYPELSSASPFCLYNHPTRGFQYDSGIHWGYNIRKEMGGWCIFVKREILERIGRFDEKIKFWHSDDDYVQMLIKYNFRHALITSSRVDHLESKTLNTKSDYMINRLTSGETLYYEYKWLHKNLLKYQLLRIKFFINYFRYKYLLRK